MWNLVFVVLVAGTGVWTVSALAPLADLSLLPRHRRERVEWCRLHHAQVGAVCAALAAGLVVAQLL